MPSTGHLIAIFPLAQLPEGLIAVALPALLGILALSMVATMAGIWATFSKAGIAGWKSLIPIYNAVLLLQIAKRPVWWLVFLMLPVVQIVPMILISLDLAKRFDRGLGFGIGLAFLPFVFFPILGFGSARYENESLLKADAALSDEPEALSDSDKEAKAGQAENELSDENGEEADLQRKFLVFQATPAWLVSTLVHVIILLILGLVTIADPTQIVNVLSASTSADDGPEMEEFAIEQIDAGDVSEVEDITEPVDVSDTMEIAEPVEVEPMEIATVDLDMSDLASEMAPSAASLQTLASTTMQPMGSRSTDMKKKLLRDYGGTPSSEAAVTEALKWFSRHQMPNGGWTYQHDLVCRGACKNGCEPGYAKSFNAATAMALLPFLGAGQTHISGEFRRNVQRGLAFLIQNGKLSKKNGLPVLDLRDGKGNMYSHGLAAIALCEAYAMTEDPVLIAPAQASLNFIITAQCSDGGWRYSPSGSGGGDTSVVGWQLMALKSGYMGHLAVPPQTIQGAMLFLDKVQSNSGAVYGYTGPVPKFRAATTSVGLLCRMYTGWDKTHPGIIGGVEGLSKHGVSKTDFYYNYYAAQVLRQYGGAEWDKFNVEMRDYLVATQAQKDGAKGSWYVKGGHTSNAGRLCITSFATMMLEVYYRHMPLYAEAAGEDDFPL
ncbi:MAG: DUF5684 domain-containing protein [Rubripirellula sp.]|nr:DUF5684 domain-containing protein [Rubripirellula sp.]